MGSRGSAHEIPSVSLVIPGRNVRATLGKCLAAVQPMQQSGQIGEVIYVDDGSTDESRTIAASYPVTTLATVAAGRGAARNHGWRRASGSLVWFLDADCIAERDALTVLLPHLEDPDVAGVGGSYGNMVPESLLACLIHEEIVARHARMPRRVDFLATFNVLYRRAALETVGGFDESLLRAQDADLAYRVRRDVGALEFDMESRVGHFHPTRLASYLRAQRNQGYWRMALYAKHPGAARGDAYSGWTDHLQPPMAILAALGLPFLLLQAARPWAAAPLAILALLQIPMTARILSRTREIRYLLFAPFAMIRALARGFGLISGAIAALTGAFSSRERAANQKHDGRGTSS